MDLHVRSLAAMGRMDRGSSYKVGTQGGRLLSRLDPMRSSVKAVVRGWSEGDRFEKSAQE